jgi:3-dehydroquinate dehydratase-2
MKFIVLNGPNLNLLGKRDANQYGILTLNDIEQLLKTEYSDDYFEFYQSNHEGDLIDKIQNASSFFDGLIINPGGYSHTSVAIRDALAECKIPRVEVHLSNIAGREDFRKTTITASVCSGYLSGFKDDGYVAAVFLLKRIIRKEKN